MKTKFLLKRKGGRGNTHPIYVALYEGDQTEIIYTGQRINLKDWSEAERQPKDQEGEISKEIDKVKSAINLAKKRLEARELPTTPFTVRVEYMDLKKEKQLKQLASDKKSKENLKLATQLIDNWLENNLFGYAKSTKKSIIESLKQFKEFLRISGYGKIERKDLTTEVITSYERFLQEKKRLSNSTHGKRMKHLRWFLKTLNYDVSTINIRTHKKEIIALTASELESLENVDVTDNSDYQKAKDLFLLGCYTGLRISDLKRINETRIIDGKICMTLQKNKKEVTIPVRQETENILKRYDMKAPKIGEQALNKSIKDVCEKAKINKILTVKTNVAGKDVDTRHAKHELITSHTASKTFITLAPQKFGLTPAEIASIVGKDLKTLINHYFQLPLETAIQKMTNV